MPNLVSVCTVSQALLTQDKDITPLIFNMSWKELPQSKYKDKAFFLTAVFFTRFSACSSQYSRKKMVHGQFPPNLMTSLPKLH